MPALAPSPVRPPAAAASSVETAAAAYLEFARSAWKLDDAETAEDAREAWEPLDEAIGSLGKIIACGGPTDREEAEHQAGFWLERLRERVASGPPGPELFDAAVRAILWGEIAARSAGREPPRWGGRPGIELLRLLVRRSQAALAALEMGWGEPESARARLARLGRNDPSDRALLAEAALSRGDLAAAAAEAAAVAEVGPGSPHATRLDALLAAAEAGLALAAADPLGAVRRLEREYRDGVAPAAELELALGLALRAAGRPLAALPHLAAGVGRVPEALVELARTRLRTGDPQAARNLLSAAEDPAAGPAAALALAEVDRFEGRPVAALERLAGIDPAALALPSIRLARAAALTDRGDPRAAHGLLLACPPDPAPRPDWLSEAARALRLDGEPEAAADALARALAHPASGLREALEAALLDLAMGRMPDPHEWSVEHAARIDRAQEYWLRSSWTAEQDPAARRLVVALAEEVRRRGVPLGVRRDDDGGGAWFHLLADCLPRPGEETA